MTYHKQVLLLFLVIIISACSNSGDKRNESDLSNPFQTDEATQQLPNIDSLEIEDTHYIIFYSIDDKVIVYVNGEEIHNTGVVKGDQHNLSLVVGLDKYLKKGDNDIKVELYNGSDYLGHNQKWEVYYELFREKEPIDFAHKKSKNGVLGLVFEMQHEIHIK